MVEKYFIFLYPIPEIIDFEIKNNGWHEKGGINGFKRKYKKTLNRCIDIRYRQKGYTIVYALFNGHQISDIIEKQPSDKIIEVGIDFHTHTSKRLYPDQDHILNQLNGAQVIRIAGFHMWDCVEKLAKRAYKKGLDVLVDEDLTEFFAWRIKAIDFRIDKYSTYNAKKYQGTMLKDFMEARKHRPWLWQNY
ncbi:hypothetical protein KJ934_02205 [Patescibacteria group bacterium]|nr:hypothetical protein [Patescibacteria group bacterium]MBU4353392.1 hypothetical protein [Patescibacteria group bacterium]MBU4477282.1 hypothetical protein [Patescibacteria group bacterium]MCG2699205.1 hypothetical protein [Candidatus Parcubacteria bacterium]